ncbi:Eco57I restriction-modification methylase domain-containing protein [Natrononativus amylolyticus]|uniref:Eco57I restriction-modification methylase domain-containing protein n=1 Tax=Natrononativus amylolyticus TaxID=2963434 RepID=UPI0020CD007F|nr:N-6 DNA methylase [Natrononativus amylolyticus]
MQTALTYRTNRDLFSNYYLNEHLPETEAWHEISEDELQDAYDEINELFEREKSTAPKRNESQLEEKFIRPMFRKLGVPFEVEESTSRTQRRPDYGFFESEKAAQNAFTRREEGGDFYEDAVAVADAKRWGRPLDTRGSGEHERDFENPSYQIHVYLQETPAQWAVLTDGKKWRLYYGPTSHRLDSYYEIDLATVLEKGDLQDFKYFYLFFRHEAFLEDASGDCFLDDVYGESNVFAQELGEDLQDNIYEAIQTLAEGYLEYPENDLDEAALELIHDSSLIYLYRLIFVLYAEAEGRDLLDTNNEIYEQSYSLNSLKQEVAEELDSADPKYQSWQNAIGAQLDGLFKLVDQGSEARGIPKGDLYIPAYNGGLFRTDPDDDDRPEARFLATHNVGDAYLARVIELLTRSQNDGGKIFVDYSSLDVRHLGSIYEGLLEYQLNIAHEPLALENGEYVIPDEDDEIVVEEGEVYLTTGSGERKSTGSYYTPEYIVEYIVENTLGPLVDDIRERLVGQSAFDEGGFAAEFAEEVFELKILDPAMGSGHFLTGAVDYLAREIIDAQEKQVAQQGVETVDKDRDINWARRQVAQRCIYGVDLNPLAVELAKVSLWLRTLAAEQPLAFLDHHLKAGNSLVGSDIEEIEELESAGGGDELNASLADFGVARKGTIEQLMRIYGDFIAIENQELADAKEMESRYDEFEQNKLRQRLQAMANVHTAEDSGLDNLPRDAYEQMAAVLEDDGEWKEIEQMQWFQDAQQWAADTLYFHWRLEYPEVFYEENGSERANPGFDAVIGNPPWVITSDEDLSSYLWQKYQYQSGQPDLYRFFIEQCITLSRSKFSMITPSSWLTIPAASDLRKEIIGSRNLHRTSLVPQSAFEDVDANMCTFTVDLAKSSDEITILDLSETGESTKLREVPFDSLENDSYRITLWANITQRRIVSEMDRGSVSLGEISDRTVGYQLYHTDIHDPEIIDQKSHHSGHKESESYVPEIRSSSLYKYYVDPEADGYVNLSAEFFRIPPEKFRKGDRVLIREITGDDGITAANVERELLFPKSVISLVVENDQYSTGYITALLNSNLLSFEFLVTGEKATQDLFPRLSMSSLDRLSIRKPPVGHLMSTEEMVTNKEFNEDDIIQIHKRSKDTAEFLDMIVEDIKEMKEEAHLLNTDISDYLGSYEWGESIDEMSGVQPSPGISDSVLSETTDSKDKLHIDGAKVKDGDTKTTIYLIARYKPKSPERCKTDRYGYTKTRPIPAFEFIGLDENKNSLLKEFVPYAVSRADGFADFRDNATKQNSLLDRLMKLKLPDLSDVEGGLNRYIETRNRHDELQEKIERRIDLINSVVYELYEISEEDINVVEDAVTKLERS